MSAMMPDMQSMMGGPGGPDPSSIQIPNPDHPDNQGPAAQSDLPTDPVEALQALIEGVRHYMDIEPDQVDKQSAAKVLVLLQNLLAQDQKDKESALPKGPLSPRVMRKMGQM